MADRIEPPFRSSGGGNSGGGYDGGGYDDDDDDRPRKPKKQKKQKAPKRRSGRETKWKRRRRIIANLIALAAVGMMLAFFIMVYYAYDLPDVDKLDEDKEKPSIVILDSNNQFLASYGDVYTEYVKYDDIPKSLIDAVIATEDRRFFDHWGVDLRGLARAIFVNLSKGRLAQGGSTVTQQLAKNVFLKPDRNLKRKIQEAMLAVWIERRYSKQQIMEMYLNRVYLGGGVYGIDAASRKYFNKPAKRMNLFESAMIAGMLKAPTSYSPQNNLKASVARTEQVLINMVDNEKITQKQMNKAYRQGAEIKFSQPRDSDKYFTDYVVDLIPEFIGKTPDKIIVKTTLKPEYQKMAEDAIAKNMLEYGDNMHASQAAIVSMSPTGAIRALIGGVDYSMSQFNRAVQAKRQPGSSFKLFVYLSAIINGMAPDSIVEDSPVKIGKWTPSNFDNQYHGLVSLREAFTRSLNAATVNIAEITGRENVLSTAKRLGIKSPLASTPSVSLGASEVTLLEMTGAYAVMANHGIYSEPYAIELIKTPKGQVLYEHYNSAVQAVDEYAVGQMNELLISVINYGTGRAAALGRPAGGKTGTSQDYRDAWFIGFTPQVVTGVWVGNDDNTSMKKVTGGSIPAHIWKDFMEGAVSGLPAEAIPTAGGYYGGDAEATPGENGQPQERKQNNDNGGGFWNNLVDGISNIEIKPAGDSFRKEETY